MEIAAEITDRFGPPPVEVMNLVGLVGVRIAARDCRVTGIKHRKGTISLTFFEKAHFDTEGIVRLVKEEPNTFALSPDGSLRYRPEHASGDGLLGDLKNVLQRLAPYVTL